MIYYKEYEPGNVLSPYIKCFWEYCHNNDISVRELAFPKGFLNLIFLRDGSFTVVTPGSKDIYVDQSILAPHLSTPALFEYSTHFSVIGVTIYPWANRIILGHPCFHFTDEFISTLEIFGVRSKEISEQVREKDTASSINILRKFFSKLVLDSNIDRPLRYAVKEIVVSGGSIALDNLTRNMNLTSRRVQQKFYETIGYGPKYFSRIVRFKQLVSKLPLQRENNLTKLAYEMNYSDQSHMIKEFRHFTGLNPARYIEHLSSSEQMLRVVQSEIKRDSC